MRRFFSMLATAGALNLFVYQGAAQAYIDPASGSLIIQGLIAFFVGAAFTLKNFYRTKVRAFLDFVLRRNKPDPESSQAREPKS